MKKRNLKVLLITTLIATMVAGTTITSFAADTIVPGVQVAATDNINAQRVIYSVFDADYYAKQYPDVAKACNNDATKLFAHYITYGMYEGRDASANFNLDAYACANQDLVKAYGTGKDAMINYFKHYANFGSKENRVATISGANNAGISVVSVAEPAKVVSAPVAKAAVSAPAKGSSGSSSSGSSGSHESHHSDSGSHESSSSSSDSGSGSSSAPSSAAASSSSSSSNESNDSGGTRHYDFVTNE